jgi:uncharacterized protein YecE (DUF72 family)
VLETVQLCRVGCSGWNYASWRGRFYPRDLPAARWLQYYAARFDSEEINNTFYRLPERATFEAWGTLVPAQFVFAVKASRFLTHMKRLLDPSEPLERLLTRAGGLGRKRGPVLYQLPPMLKIDLPRLDDFLRALPRSSSTTRFHVMEFRHPSWYTADTFALLARRRVALCLHDKEGSAIKAPIVGPCVYLRFHGTSGRYHGSYSRRQLDWWAHVLADEMHQGRTAFAYFNNDPQAVAVRNALTLREMIEKLV